MIGTIISFIAIAYLIYMICGAIWVLFSIVVKKLVKDDDEEAKSPPINKTTEEKMKMLKKAKDDGLITESSYNIMRKSIVRTASLIPKTKILGLTPYSLTKGRTTVGRDNTNDIVINQDTVSWQHAEIVKNGDQYEIYDLNSVNGTFINGKRIKHGILEDGALITLADVSFLFKID